MHDSQLATSDMQRATGDNQQPMGGTDKREFRLSVGVHDLQPRVRKRQRTTVNGEQ
jgi:hypothetical protein